MKLTIILAVVVAIAAGIWQRVEIRNLHAEEGRVRAVVHSEGTSAKTPASVSSNALTPPATRAPVSKEELAHFTADLISKRADFETDRWHDKHYATGKKDRVDFEVVSRLTVEQMHTFFAAWDADGAQTDMHERGSVRLLMAIGTINPRATLEFLYQLREQRGEKMVPSSAMDTFKAWFQQDPEALLRWAREKGFPEGFENQSGIWGDAAAAMLEPTAENVARFVAHRGYSAETAATEIGWRLMDKEKWIAFFKHLHAATDGKSDNVTSYVWSWVQKVPFTQAANVADSVPDFRPAIRERVSEGREDVVGSLRYNIARFSRDGTPGQRWDWLVSRPADYPKGRELVHLINQWCEREYKEVAEWARALPPSPARSEIRKAILDFVKDGRSVWPPEYSKKLAAEWESP